MGQVFGKDRSRLRRERLRRDACKKACRSERPARRRRCDPWRFQRFWSPWRRYPVQTPRLAPFAIFADGRAAAASAYNRSATQLRPPPRHAARSHTAYTRARVRTHARRWTLARRTSDGRVGRLVRFRRFKPTPPPQNTT